MYYIFKNKCRVSLLLSLFSVLLCTIVFFSACHQKEDSTDLSDQDKTTILQEDVLPKGKLVIEDDLPIQHTLPPGKTVPLGSTDNTQTGHNNTVEFKGNSRLEFLKKKYKNLLVFHADDTMEVRKPKLATLILGNNESIDNLRFEVLDEQDAKSGRIVADTAIGLGSKMRARLIPFGSSKTDNSFEIEALGDDYQTFKKGRDKILWQWKITPLKPGNQTIKLSVQVIEKDGEATTLPAKSIPVVIVVKPEKFLTKVSNFIEKKYEWILTAIFLPIFLAWVTTKVKNKSAAKG